MKRLHILVVGGGGREHALAWRCAQEGHRVSVAPGNDGIAQDAACLPVDPADPAAVVRLAREQAVDLVVVGPEAPLVAGLADALVAAEIPVVGPSAQAARLEGSKAFAKAFMARHRIPTARHRVVEDVAGGVRALGEFSAPPVVKADGLAAGKGVVVPDTFEEAEAAVRACLEDARFGAAGAQVVLEERLLGQEISVFALTDGARWRTFAPAQDHKRLLDGDRGPNTGGMGAYAPAPVATAAVMERVEAEILAPTLAGARAEGFPFVGFLFLGLMVDPEGAPRVIEYNVRFGDPEAQPLMLGLRDELAPRLWQAARGELEPGAFAGDPAATVVVASAGYPASSSKGDPIEGLERAGSLPGVKVFHAGTRRTADGWVTHGGRVLGVCARGDDLPGAIARAYEAVEQIHIPGMQVRRDIGARALAPKAP